MAPYDWTKHLVESEVEEPTAPSQVEVPVVRTSINGFVLRRMQSKALERWANPEATGDSLHPLRQRVSNEENGLNSCLESVRSSNADKRTRPMKTKSAPMNRTRSQTQSDSAPRRVLRRADSSIASGTQSQTQTDSDPSRRVVRRDVSSTLLRDGETTRRTPGTSRKPTTKSLKLHVTPEPAIRPPQRRQKIKKIISFAA